MLEFYEPGAAIIEDSVAKSVARLTKTNKSALDFMVVFIFCSLISLRIAEAKFRSIVRCQTGFIWRLRLPSQRCPPFRFCKPRLSPECPAAR